MKKLFLLFLGLGIALVGCGGNTSSASDDITVYTRDASSGTRGAFEELVGFEGELTDTAIETSGNGDMATKVGNDESGIGYVSLTTDFEGNNLKKVMYNSVEATEENVINGSYELSRPFSYVTRAAGDFDSADKEAMVVAFLDFLNNSLEGREMVKSEGGIVAIDGAKPWSELMKNHPILEQDNSDMIIILGGSTSVENTIVAAYEAFEPFANGATFQANLTGSGDGYKRVLGEEKDGANYSDIGFASRDFKAEENTAGALDSGVYCKDAIVVVVSNDNTMVDDLTQEEVYKIFTGEVTSWSEL